MIAEKLKRKSYGARTRRVEVTCVGYVEAISKPQIAFEGKVEPMIKRSIHVEYVSILMWPSTQPSVDR